MFHNAALRAHRSLRDFGANGWADFSFPGRDIGLPTSIQQGRFLLGDFEP